MSSMERNHFKDILLKGSANNFVFLFYFWQGRWLYHHLHVLGFCRSQRTLKSTKNQSVWRSLAIRIWPYCPPLACCEHHYAFVARALQLPGTKPRSLAPCRKRPVETLQFQVGRRQANLITPLSELKLKKGVLIAATIIRNSELFSLMGWPFDESDYHQPPLIQNVTKIYDLAWEVSLMNKHDSLPLVQAPLNRGRSLIVP